MESKIPNYIRETFSSKFLTLATLGNINEFLKDNGADFQALILTPYGFITCDLELEKTSDTPLRKTETKNNYTLDLTCLRSLVNESMVDYESTAPDIKPRDNGTFLNLKNVTIYSNGLNDSIATPAVKMDEFVIFVDHIIGFSLISRNVD